MVAGEEGYRWKSGLLWRRKSMKGMRESEGAGKESEMPIGSLSPYLVCLFTRRYQGHWRTWRSTTC